MKQRLSVSWAALVAAFVFLFPQGATPPVLALQQAGEQHGARPLAIRALQAWSTPELVKGEPSLVDCRNPILVVNQSTEETHLVWEEDGIIRYALRDASGWKVDTGLALAGDRPVLALDESGYPHIVYACVASDDGQLHIMHCARSADGWTPPMVVSSTQGPSTDPDISLIIASSIHIVWAGKLEGSEQIYHARSSDSGQTWFSIQPIPGARGLAPTLALAPDGGAWVAWQSIPSGGNPAAIYAAHWSGESWSEAVNVSGGAESEARGPDIGCDSAGQAHLVWEDETEEGDLAVRYAAGRDGNWGAPQRISGSAEVFATQPYLALDPDDMLYVVWDAGSSLDLRRANHGNWGGIERIAVNQAGIRDVSLVAASGGALRAAWSARNASGVWDLIYSQRAQDETPTPTGTPSPTATITPTSTPESTIPPPPTETSTPQPTATPTVTITPSATRTATTSPSLTPSRTRTIAPTARPTENTPTQTAEVIKTYTPLAASVYVPVLLKSASSSDRQSPDPGGVMPLSRPDSARGMAAGWVWSPVDNVSWSPADSHSATLLVAQDGVSYSVWEEQLATGGSILCYSRRAVGVWSSPTCFFVGEEPDLAAGPDGTVHLTYANEFAGQYDVFYTTWTGSGWSTPENVSHTSGTSSQPALAVKPNGGLILVWTDTTEGYSRIYYGWKDNGVWNTYFVPASIGGSAPDVAVGKNNRVWVTWQVLEEPDQYDIYAIYGDGISWSPYAMNISATSSSDSVAARVAGVNTWGAFVVWHEKVGAGEILYADTLQYTDWWSEPFNLSQTATLSEGPSIVANTAHELHVAWDEGAQILHRYRSPEGTWSPKSAIATGSAAIGEVDLALGVGRTICAQWSQPLVTSERDVYWRNGAFDTVQSLYFPLTRKQ